MKMAGTVSFVRGHAGTRGRWPVKFHPSEAMLAQDEDGWYSFIRQRPCWHKRKMAGTVSSIRDHAGTRGRWPVQFHPSETMLAQEGRWPVQFHPSCMAEAILVQDKRYITISNDFEF